MVCRCRHPCNRGLDEPRAAGQRRGEAETVVRHPDLLDSLVASARDPVAAQATLAELRALISPRGFRPSMRFSREGLRRLPCPP